MKNFSNYFGFSIIFAFFGSVIAGLLGYNKIDVLLNNYALFSFLSIVVFITLFGLKPLQKL
jgi:hypothetical protein